MNKKGAIGITLTWITAFLIIFFIIFLFVSASGLLASGKIVKGDSNKITLTNDIENMEIQREFTFFLNMPLKTGKTMKQEIISLELARDEDEEEKIRENIVKEARAFLESSERKRKCYLFEVKGLSNSEDISINSRLRHVGFDLDSYLPANTNLFVNHQKIKITLYTEKC